MIIRRSMLSFLLHTILLASMLANTGLGEEIKCLKSSEQCVSKYRQGEKGEYTWDFIVERNTLQGKKTISSLISEHKDTFDSTKTSLENLEKHFESIFQEWKEIHNSSEKTGEPVCTLGVDPRIKNRAMYYGFGFPDDCGYNFRGEADDRKNKLRENKALRPSFVTNNVKSFADGLIAIKNYAVENYDLGWKSSHINDEMVFTDSDDIVRDCVTYRAMGYKWEGKWSISAKIAKRPWYYYAPKRGKEILTEFITVDGLKALPLTMPICDECGVSNQNTTSTASLWYGNYNDDWYYYWEKYHRDQARHPALRLVLSNSDHEKELVEDSGAISNAAILMLPVFLTLLPLGLFQEVSAKFLIIYSLVTDVFSCMPIIIRGIELLVVGYKTFEAIESKIYGSVVDNHLAVAQAWSAKCTVKPVIRNRGYGFLFFGIAAMLVGLGLEFLTWALTNRAKKRLEEKKMALQKQDKPIDVIDQEAENVGLIWYLRNNV